MASTVMGMFKDSSSAHEVVGELLLSGFRHDQIGTFSPHVTAPGGSRDDRDVFSELKREGGMDSFFRSLASAFTDYDQLTVYSNTDKQSHVVLMVNADTEEMVNRAVEIIERRSSLDINDFYSPSGGAHQASMAGLPQPLRSLKRSGKALVLSEEYGGPTDRSPNP